MQDIIALGDIDESTMPAILESMDEDDRAELEAYWAIIQPILARNPGWVWRDAVKWMTDNGKLEEARAKAAMRWRLQRMDVAGLAKTIHQKLAEGLGDDDQG
jgi:hypothetical protein